MDFGKLNRGKIIENLQKGSKWIGVFCLLAVLFNLAAAVWPLIETENRRLIIGDFKIGVDMLTKIALCRCCISSGIIAVIMLLAAVMFFRIAKDGMPFQAKHVRMVRIISILFLLNAVVPLAAVYCISGSLRDALAALRVTPVMEGLLFLFVARIIRYGAMLQEESDETL